MAESLREILTRHCTHSEAPRMHVLKDPHLDLVHVARFKIQVTHLWVLSVRGSANTTSCSGR